MNTKSSWNVYRTRFLVRACQLTESLAFSDSLGREHSGQPGDYLVESSAGIRRIISQALFEDIYVALSPAQFGPASTTISDIPSRSLVSHSSNSVLVSPNHPIVDDHRRAIA